MANLPIVRKKTVCRNLRNYFREYCDSSSIHGIRYFGERRTYFERGWWLMVFLLCLAGCAYFIVMVYQKWENSPVIVSFATRETPIYEIPFPAVTICPESKAVKERYSHSKIIKKYLDGNHLTDEEYRQASYMNLLCELNMTEPLSLQYRNSSLNETFDNCYYSDNGFFEFLFNVTPRNYLTGCMWMNKEYDCDELFDLVITDEGICATFNMLDKSHIYKEDVYFQDIPFSKYERPKNVTWSLDEGYAHNEGIDTFPRRALFAGAKNGLSVILHEPTLNIDSTCKLSLQGYKVSLHTPSRVPRPSQQYFRLPLNEVVVSAVQPVMITTSDTVKEYKPEKRECYFQNDKPLKHFKLYTQRNCQLECLTNFTYEWCWCVNFFMPRHNGTDVCGSLSKPCMEEAEEILQKGSLANILDLKKKDPTNKHITKVPECNCLPLCTDLSYGTETTTSAWDWKSIQKEMAFNDTDTRTYEISSLIIYFKNNQFVTSRRHELYGATDFLGNFGGLLGLFTGFSVLSLMEIIYFLTVRIICNIRLFGNWSGYEKDLEKNL